MPSSLLTAADRIQAGPLAALILLPVLTGSILGGALVAALPEAAGDLGAFTFTLGVVKLCYLGTAAAHFGRWLVESSPVRLWLATEPQADTGLTLEPDAGLFPGALDGCLLALWLATLVQAMLR